MRIFLAMILIACSVAAQDKPAQEKPGGAHDMGSGVANIGKGAAKGAGSAAKGAAKGAGKDVAVGSAKGVGKITRGVGKLFKKAL
jgi:hypothetical protein